jgi:homoserine/homoserine lactone efflux protein
MNYHLFSAFLLITFILVIVPGPIVTLVITTGATRGIRAALITVLGSTLGNAVNLHCPRPELDSADFGGSF